MASGRRGERRGEEMSSVQPKRIEAGGTVMALALAAPGLVYLLVRTDQRAGYLLVRVR
jgi:hypothetical protein